MQDPERLVAQDYTASKWQSLDLKPGSLEPHPLSTILHLSWKNPIAPTTTIKCNVWSDISLQGSELPVCRNCVPQRGSSAHTSAIRRMIMWPSWGWGGVGGIEKGEAEKSETHLPHLSTRWLVVRIAAGATPGPVDLGFSWQSYTLGNPYSWQMEVINVLAWASITTFRNLWLTVRRLRSPRSKCRPMWFLVRTLPGLQVAAFFLCAHMAFPCCIHTGRVAARGVGVSGGRVHSGVSSYKGNNPFMSSPNPKS